MIFIKDIIWPALLILIVTAGSCGLDGNINDETPSAIIEVRFINAEDGSPVADTDVLISVVFEGEDRIEDQGSVTTDVNGAIEAIISHSTETMITTLIFTLEIDEDAEITVQEDVNLELRTEEPLDRANLEFEI